MAATLDEVLNLARQSHSLSEQQLSNILALAPDMGPADLDRLKAMLTNLQEAEVKDMKNELDMRKKVAVLQKGWQGKQDRTALEARESAAQKNDLALAEAALRFT